jgi:ABC-type branched-chain amino acid transport systems, periplasmic component
MKRLSLILVLILVAASIVTAQDIKVGGVGPVTGEAATFGVSTKNGIMLAAEEWNAKGGLFNNRKVRIIFEDDKGDPAEGATVYTKLIQQDNVVAIIGTVMSQGNLGREPLSPRQPAYP